MSVMNDKFHYECTDCGAAYDAGSVMYLCPACEKENIKDQPIKGVLRTVYDFSRILKKFRADNVYNQLSKESFLSVLPLRDENCLPRLKIGDTPLYRIDPEIFERPNQIERNLESGHRNRFSDNRRKPEKSLNFNLFIKDDSQNPTFSFKDRASALVSAWAKEHGIMTIVAASTGNAGSSIAGICASQGQHAVIVAPAKAPMVKLTQIMVYGATLIPVDGAYDDAFDLSRGLTQRFGWYNRNTAFNPITIEGKKGVAWELYGQLGRQVPDRIFIPVGDGVIYSGVAKGFEDLMNLGITDRMPALVAVQSEKSANLIRNLERPRFISKPARTFADSIRVNIPRNFNMARQYMHQYNGESILVTDDEIRKAILVLARRTGIFSEPAAAAAFAGLFKYRELGLIPGNSTNVVLLTGSGLKDINPIKSRLSIPQPVEPTSGAIERYLEKWLNA